MLRVVFFREKTTHCPRVISAPPPHPRPSGYSIGSCRAYRWFPADSKQNRRRRRTARVVITSEGQRAFLAYARASREPRTRNKRRETCRETREPSRAIIRIVGCGCGEEGKKRVLSRRYRRDTIAAAYVFECREPARLTPGKRYFFNDIFLICRPVFYRPPARTPLPSPPLAVRTRGVTTPSFRNNCPGN